MKVRSLGWMSIVAIAIAVALIVGGNWSTSSTAAVTQPFQVAQETPEATPPAAVESTLPLSGDYEDPQGAFQVGILDGYSVSSAAGSPLFQSGDGSLAYSVVRVPLNSETPLSDIGLVEIAQSTLGRGEGFQTQTFNTVPGGGLQIAWSGRLSQGAAPPQPVSGTVLVKQQGDEAYLLVVAALEAAASQVPAMVSTLIDTLTIQ